MPAVGHPAPSVRVVCVIFNPGGELNAFAASLATATSATYELVLVNNGAPNDVARSLVDSGAARLVESGGNVGYGRAANLGARGSTAPWLVVANPDVVWHPGSLDALLGAAARHPRAGAFGPKILDEDGTVYPSARAIPSLGLGAGHALLARAWPSNPISRRYRRENATEHDTERPVGWLSGALLLLRREAFEDVQGFDTAYFMFFEDLDLGERLGSSGWENVVVPSATVTHAQGTSWKRTPEPMIRAHHASARRYVRGRYRRWYQAPVRWSVVLGLHARELAEVALSRRARSR
ncbi:glycosyltransferase family 2 protein [Cellulosimicrobium sp. CUA-896]|uniref:glycosyltransferase family 2 protein n=1 Tax=Cellulosimicrobium sp. CUA-896 TaxID=1517881 RepID=UPI000961F8D2|nr:glycosyltransferase family 2 protein [Cellulosimicrobium sp. CUA-896]OLT55440.1 N-acetylglucosaminyl-diphospho-decaprenol L-rhamnosyltransferase [Cellulosimicrobium sp. CUA-896]